VTDHVSDLQWDRMLAGELALDRFSAAHAHAHGCEACAARLRALTAERDAFNVRPFAMPRPRARRRWLVPLVAAAAAVVIAVRLAPWPGPDEPRARAKGSARTAPMAADDLRVPAGPGAVLLLTVGRPDALTSVSTGDVIHPGDYLQAGYTAGRDGFGAVLSRDGAGAVNAYVPPGGADMVALPAGIAQSFPRSTILDGALGSERIAVVWCATAHPLEPLLAALRAREVLRVPDDCMAREVVLDKRGPSP
jgi:hypothetical protein